MKQPSDIVRGLSEIQEEFNFGDFKANVIETTEDMPGHFQLKIPGDTVAKQNDFVRFRFFMRGGKDPIAYRLFAHFVACLHNRKDDEMGFCEIKVREFMPNSSGADYVRARQAMEALASLIVEQHDNEKQIINLVFENELCYNRRKGTLIAKLNPNLKRFFLQLYENYITYGLLEFSGLRSFYSQRLFEIACSIRPKPEEIFPLIKLQRMLDITEGSLLRYSDFKRWVLEAAKKDIHKYTNMKFDYVPIKEGRAVTYIKIKAKRMNRDADILAE